MGTGGALHHARSLLADTFVVIYGDSYLPINYQDVGRSLTTEADAVIAVYHDSSAETGVRPNVAVAPNGAILRYEKNAQTGDTRLEYVEAGVLALRRSVLDLIPSDRAVSLEEEIFPVLIAQHRLFGFRTSQRFFDMGTPERLKIIEAYLA